MTWPSQHWPSQHWPSQHWPTDLAPHDLRQPDRVSCGAASVLAARVVTSNWRPEAASSWAEEIRSEHRLLTSRRSPRDRFQMPWPRALGTPPWAVANALRALTGQQVATVNARPRPYLGYEVVVETLRTRPVAIYLGNAWLPRHVVLALRHDLGSIEVFDPGSGALHHVERRRWVEHEVGIAGWNHLWFVL